MLDYYAVGELFETEDRQIQSSAREYLEAEVKPCASLWWEEGEFPREPVSYTHLTLPTKA